MAQNRTFVSKLNFCIKNWIFVSKLDFCPENRFFVSKSGFDPRKWIFVPISEFGLKNMIFVLNGLKMTVYMGHISQEISYAGHGFLLVSKNYFSNKRNKVKDYSTFRIFNFKIYSGILLLYLVVLLNFNFTRKSVIPGFKNLDTNF